jgi:hypothetical protein
MRKRPIEKVIALIALFGLVAGGCRFFPQPAPTPTLAPATPRPAGEAPAVIVQRTPERGQALAPEGTIELIFDRAMDPTTVERAFQIEPDVRGTFEWVDERTLHFKPARALPRDTTYKVALDAQAKAADGNALADPYRFQFRTVGYLEVAQVVPAPEAADVEADSTITVIFNRPVVPLTAVSDPAYAERPQPLRFDPPIAGQGEWLNTSIYVFTPDEPLAGGSTYTARVEAGLEDTTGGILEEDYTWTFSTQPPQVVWVSPGEDVELVGVETTVQVEFNMPIDAASARETFHLRAGRGSVEGTVEVQDATLTFTPTERLAFGQTYTAWVDKGLQGLGGGEGMREDYAWQFTTVPFPRILRTEPADGESNASPHTNFRIIFNAPIDPSTVMPHLSMSPPLSPSQVYTYFSRWDNTFTLDFGAEPSTDYEVRIEPGIADPYGNTIEQGVTVNFRTGPLPPWAALTIPGMVGTLDAHRPARVVVSHVNVPRVTLRLHRLDRETFFRAQNTWWEYEPSGTPLRRWSVDVDAPRNEFGYTAVDLVEDGGPIAPGIYVLEIEAPGVDRDRWAHRRLLVASRYNLTVKAGQEEMWAWVTDLATGRPAPDLTLTAYTFEGEPLEGATTDAEGLARFPLETNYRRTFYVAGEEPFVLAGSDQEWSSGITPWDFGLEANYESARYRAHVYTDRPIYRPGQTIHFRGVIRAEDDVQYSLPDAGPVEVTVYDNSRGEQLYQETLALDEFGSFDGQVTLGEGASLGPYSINVELDRQNFHHPFTVAAYRPPEFEVTVTPEEREVPAGQGTAAQVAVRYFFGGPVADAQVEWNVLSAPYRFEPAQFGRYTFTDEGSPWICYGCWWWEPPQPDLVLSGSGTTGAEGELAIALPSEVMTGGQRLTVEATAYGKDGQTISGRDIVVVHPGAFYVGLAPQQYVGEADQEMSVDLVTVDWAGERSPDRELDVTVYRREWVNTFVENALGGGSWEWEAVDTPVYTTTLTTDGQAEGTVTFTPEEGGSYRVVASGRDRRERLVRSSIWVWVSGREYVSWRRENNDRLTLISDKTSYTPGETAEILIPSPFRGEQWAWVTVERGGILKQEVIRLENNSSVYRLPITAAHAPNIYVSAVIVKGPDADEPVATHKVGYVMLTVEPEAQTLDVTLTPSVERAQPGDTVRFEVEVRDHTGEPAQTQFSLDLVDKAVLSLMPRTPDAVVQAFYARRGLGVSTASGLSISVNRLIEEQMEQLNQVLDEAQAARGLGGGMEELEAEEMVEEPAAEAPMAMATMTVEEARGDADGAAPMPPGVQLREEFADTAFWDASVVTGADGRATVEVALPDNLTTWVLRGVGVTRGTEVGEETTDLLVTKPLLVRPVTPRFFVVEDRVQLAALVSNNTGTAQEVEVTLHATGVTSDDPATQTVSVPAGGEERVTWWVTVEDVAAADVSFSAVAGEYADAARPRLTTGPEGTLLVHRYTAPENVGTGGQLTEEGTRTEVVALPPKYDDRRGELSVRLDPSLAAAMTEGLDYLEHFPYECTEQTVSRFLPNVLTYRALQDLGLSDPALEEHLPALVEEGLSKLYAQQHPDGGWGWWPEGESNPTLSAYVVFALTKAREAGFEVREDMRQRGLDYIAGGLVGARELQSYREANRQAFVLYVMAEAGQARRASEYAGALYRRREKLSHYGRAFLALTLERIEPGDRRIATLLSDLQNAAILSATGAHWEEEQHDWWAMNTDTRSTAIILDAMIALDPENALIPQGVRWLMVARRDGIWETTQETAWALIALTDWMAHTGELEGNYEYAVRLNEELMAEGQVTPETIDESVELQVAVADLLREAGNRLDVARGPGEGRLYYTAHMQVYLPVEEIEPLDRGIIVQRTYVDPGCTEGIQCPQVDAATVGDVVQVRLTIIAPHDLYYVVVEDPLPAGAEAIDTSLATTSLLEQDPTLHRDAASAFSRAFYTWWWRWYSRSELRDDRVVLFADYLPAGTYEYVYTFRATQPGEYRVIPTTANEFYFPEVFGRGDGRLFTVEE